MIGLKITYTIEVYMFVFLEWNPIGTLSAVVYLKVQFSDHYCFYNTSIKLEIVYQIFP